MHRIALAFRHAEPETLRGPALSDLRAALEVLQLPQAVMSVWLLEDHRRRLLGMHDGSLEPGAQIVGGDSSMRPTLVPQVDSKSSQAVGRAVTNPRADARRRQTADPTDRLCPRRLQLAKLA